MSRNLKQYTPSKRFRGRNEYDQTSSVYSNPMNRVRNQLPQFFSRAPLSSTGYSYLTPDWLETVHSQTNPQHSRDQKYNRRYREPESLPSTSYDHYAYGHTQHHFDGISEVALEDHPKDREEAGLIQQIEMLQRKIDNIDARREPNREVINSYLPEYSQQLYSRRSPIMKTERDDYYESFHSSMRFPDNHSTNHSTLPRLMDLEVAANSRRTIPRTTTERFTRKRIFRSPQGPYEKRREPREKVTRNTSYAARNRFNKTKAPQKDYEDLKDFTSPPQLEEISENEEELPLIGLKTAHTAVQKWIADDCFPQQIRDLISEESSETLGKTNGFDDDCLFFSATENADNISLNLSEELKESLLLDFPNIADSTIES